MYMCMTTGTYVYYHNYNACSYWECPFFCCTNSSIYQIKKYWFGHFSIAGSLSLLILFWGGGGYGVMQQPSPFIKKKICNPTKIKTESIQYLKNMQFSQTTPQLQVVSSTMQKENLHSDLSCCSILFDVQQYIWWTKSIIRTKSAIIPPFI